MHYTIVVVHVNVTLCKVERLKRSVVVLNFGINNPTLFAIAINMIKVLTSGILMVRIYFTFLGSASIPLEASKLSNGI